MEIPFYYSFKEFEENYLSDFAPEKTTFLKYLIQLKKKYEDYLSDENNKIWIYKTIEYEKALNEINDVNFIEVDFVNKYVNDDFPDFLEDNYFGIIDHYLNIGHFYEEVINRYCKEYHNNLMVQGEMRMKLIRFESIVKFLNKEISNEKNILLRFQQPATPEPFETPELDFSDNSDKVKLIMLEKLGIIEYIKTIQTKPNTISHTSEILSAITGIETKTLNTYLYPMLRPYRDDDDKNSPYKNPENLEKAERELIKLKIKNTNANR